MPSAGYCDTCDTCDHRFSQGDEPIFRTSSTSEWGPDGPRVALTFCPIEN